MERNPRAASSAAVTLRPITPDDAPFLYRVYASTREEELAVIDWTPDQKAAFLKMQFDAQHAYYQQHYAGAAFQVILVDGEPAGRLYLARLPEELRIVDIALLPAYRGAGIDTRLIREVLAEAAGAGKVVRIHVEQYNPARRLYERLGFVPVGEFGIYIHMECRPDAAAQA